MYCDRTAPSDSIETTKFYINIHHIISESDPSANITWSCIKILELAIEDEMTKEILVNDIGFIPVLSELLVFKSQSLVHVSIKIADTKLYNC